MVERSPQEDLLYVFDYLCYNIITIIIDKESSTSSSDTSACEKNIRASSNASSYYHKTRADKKTEALNTALQHRFRMM